MTDIIPHPDLDFSKYQPGDIIEIEMDTIKGLGQARATLLIMHIANAASRAGLHWEIEQCQGGRVVQVQFMELELP